MLLLSASDELAAAVSSSAGGQSADFLAQAVTSLGGVGAAGSPFVVFVVGLLTVAGALLLWVELLMREAAVYVVVLMLPLAFAAFVWPARRIWAIRSLELLAALILSKFAIVAVLSLGAAALGHSVHGGVAGVLSGIVLLGLATLAPWALLRLLPLAELASGAAGAFRAEATGALRTIDPRKPDAEGLEKTTARLRALTSDAEAATPPSRTSGPPRPTAAERSTGRDEAAPAGETSGSSTPDRESKNASIAAEAGGSEDRRDRMPIPEQEQLPSSWPAAPGEGDV
jgi:hypothetical protein